MTNFKQNSCYTHSEVMTVKGKQILLAVLLGWVIPLVLLWPYSRTEDTPPQTQPDTTAEEKTTQPTNTVRVLWDDGTVKEMDPEEYLVGVILGEIPSGFGEEAIKAQAVVARTFTCKAMDKGGKHTQADVCTDPGCCQAYCAPESYLAQKGSAAHLLAVCSAVEQTKTQVLLYEGALIEATYFSCSGGRTEDAVAVWGSDVPYLQSVESPGEESAAHYMDTVSIPIKDFMDALSISGTTVRVEAVSYSRGGGVQEITLNGTVFTGNQMRSALNLRSTAFVITALPDTVMITTKGFGHRVGMSQYGAQAMAEKGSGYEEILSHYFPGTELKSSI